MRSPPTPKEVVMVKKSVYDVVKEMEEEGVNGWLIVGVILPKPGSDRATLMYETNMSDGALKNTIAALTEEIGEEMVM